MVATTQEVGTLTGRLRHTGQNPGIDHGLIAEAFKAAPIAAASEYGRDGRIAFRSDVAAFIAP